MEILILRVLHILGGLYWLGNVITMTFFIMPAMGMAGPAVSGPIMLGLRKRKLLVVTPIAALATILAGWRLLLIDARGTGMMGTAMLRTLTISGSIATLAFVVGLAVALPTSSKLMKMSTMVASGEQDRMRLASDVAALQRRMAMATMIVSILLIIAAIGMAIARYM